ncbi:MAG: ATP-dependent helicase HrpB [Hyphomicrobiaceae bacterium]
MISDILQSTKLPILAVLDKLLADLAQAGRVVLVAPPGAGKTTIVPLALLDAPWMAGKRVLVLEPRRLAARAAAERMAGLLRESVGETVGVRARLASRVGPKTRIEVITEGIFTRMVIDDPSLDGVGAILFDEFHERSLQGDFGLALSLDIQDGLREDLRLVVMSATLDVDKLTRHLQIDTVVESHGHTHPVETRYIGRRADTPIEVAMAIAIKSTLQSERGSILAFLPGQREILRTAARLNADLTDLRISVAPLYGALDLTSQSGAIRRPPSGHRKVVLATSIAETSLTIEGVRIVIDSGLARKSRYLPGQQLTRLETVRAARSSVDQRRGRAGRIEPGVCIRMWQEPENRGLRTSETPQIEETDLTDMVLDCLAWGVSSPNRLPWLTQPPNGAVDAAFERLMSLGAVDDRHMLTAHGKALRQLPMPAHLASMIIRAAETGASHDASLLSALIVERGVGGPSSDIADQLQHLRNDRSNRAIQTRRLAQRWERVVQRLRGRKRKQSTVHYSIGQLLAMAYPDRIARRRGTGTHYLMANGRGAHLANHETLNGAEYLVAADLQGGTSSSRILAAVAVSLDELHGICENLIIESTECFFDPSAAAVRSTHCRRLGAIRLSERSERVPRDMATAATLVDGIISKLGLHALPWSKDLVHVRQRVEFLRGTDANWPDLSDDTLSRKTNEWLTPFVIGKAALSEISTHDLTQAVEALIPWEMRRKLDSEAPPHFIAPTGNRFAVSYEGERAPSVALRVQEVYGLRTHPTIGTGRVALSMTLLSPADRPIQLTKNLPGFWIGSWRDVKVEMKGRYPKHSWPDNPTTASPVATGRPRARGKARKQPKT